MLGPIMGLFTRLGTLLGHFRAVLRAAPSLWTQPTWMSETSGSACGLSCGSWTPLGALLSPSWASWAVLGLPSAIFGLFWSPRRVSGHSQHGCQNCPATLAALHDPLGPFLGLCWALAWGPRTVSGHSRHGCHIRPATPAAAHGPLIAVLGPSWASVGPLMGLLGCLRTLLGHFGLVLGAAESLRIKPTWMSEASGSACGPCAPHGPLGPLFGLG